MKADIVAAFAAADHDALARLARRGPSKVVRYLTGRLCAADEQSKWAAVEAFGRLIADLETFPGPRVREVLRRFFWALNDESGAVPFGIPEAVGAILKARPEFQEEFLPILCSMVTHEEMAQAGAIERGVFWALGEVGEAVIACSPVAVKGLIAAAARHEDSLTRAVAGEALVALGVSTAGGACGDDVIQL